MAHKEKISSKDLLKILKEHPIITLVLPEDFNFQEGMHPFEKYLISNGILYYFKGKRTENKKDYLFDLNKFEVEGF